ncbi:hypothetical protein AJ80_07082 [Polytolypa hystricis UAMH7299]|uniref:LicD/FKTN/FKRP nucleotidyltransferase domain-containing protein n=1 Tax=Polytolypa hystricis (strain UAMH7299) TaxID=1447883 RepID=A0A2B7XQN9_POLH7|nr:hypothetical protein AJ80_07082 [Polytolypa hystricis UAMH7299]
MRLHWTWALLATILSSLHVVTASPRPATPVERRDDPPMPKETKYFHEPGNDDILGHYDSRYYKRVLGYDERLETLRHMARAYLKFFAENNLETWIAHGSLLGWWWSGNLLPWDWDLDTQVNTKTLFRLGDEFNQTTHEYSPEDKSAKRTYLLDINRFSRFRQRGEAKNIIDARWIDMANGLYIDITGVSELDPDKEPGMLSCKNFHKYKVSDLYPMRMSTYEGVPAKIPYRYLDILVKEYGNKSLVTIEHEGHDWDEQQKAWVPDEQKVAEIARKKEERRKKKAEEKQRKEEEKRRKEEEEKKKKEGK